MLRKLLLYLLLLPLFADAERGYIVANPNKSTFGHWGKENVGGPDMIAYASPADIDALRSNSLISTVLGGAITGQAFKLFNLSLKVHATVKDFIESSKKIGYNDCEPDFTLPSNTLIPSSCTQGGNCTECYQNAVNEMQMARQHLERIHCIYEHTKSHIAKLEALGGDVSGLNPMLGMYWENKKMQIDEKMKLLKHKANEKSAQYLSDLQKSLMAISECEAKYGQKDWFQKYGFMYFEFMKAKYEIP